MDTPEWWECPFDCTNVHVRDMMADRAFNETDIREMIEEAYSIEPSEITTRYTLFSRYDGAE